jgi:16S rRNA (cytosine967-C5)-methyltransferase
MKPRDYALRELDQRRLPGWPAGSLKKLRPAPPPTDPRDLALAENIVTGVTKNLLLLQHLVAQYSGRNLKSVDVAVQKILAIGLYQLRFLTRIPKSAAVDEAVEQAKRFGQSKASGFVNAVLRKATSGDAPPPPLPPREQPADFARLVLSHPPDVFNRLAKVFGPNKALLICEHDQAEPPTIVRLAADVDPKSLAAAGLTITRHEQPGMLVVEGAKRATLADWANRGVAQVQDPTAAAVAGFVKAEPGQTVLDRCAGLGTKTLQLHEAVGEQGRVVAMDPAEQRCAGLKQLLERRQINNVEVHGAAWLRDVAGAQPETFDRVLADVPCSNSGVLARRPEARYHQSPENLKSLAKLQDEILADTAPFVKPGGLLVYSTCSVWPEENRQRVDAFLKRHPNFMLLVDRDTLPSLVTDLTAPPAPEKYRDGGYVAVLGRRV